MDQKEVEYFIEAALLAAGKPLSIDLLQGLFDGRSTPDKSIIRAAVKALNETYDDRGIEIAEVATGFRMQVKAAMADRLGKLWEERPPRYSRALFETLALIAYRQPITRAEIEEVRGVSVSSNIMRSLVEREWVRVVGHRDVPGRPAMFGTTKGFLDYFSLKKLDDLPELADLSDWESLRVQLDLPEVDGDSPVDSADGIVAELPVKADSPADAAPEHGEAAADASDDTAEIPFESVDAAPVTGIVVDSPNELPELAPAAEAGVRAVEALDGQSDVPDNIPELTEQTHTDLPDLSSSTDESALPELPPLAESADDELKVSEWPDPVDASSIATLETNDQDPETGTNS
ncbi:MAG: SMC-Scp complex subunit ScpB [Pseudomonadota bacterium]